MTERTRPLSGKGASAVAGAVVGAALTLFAVGVGALVFGSYGYGMFVMAPFFIGFATGYLANFHGDVGKKQTVYAVCIATALGALSLLIFALEGIVCILMLLPLALPVAVLGGVAGRALAIRGKPHVANSFAGFVILPVLFALEQAYIGPGSFESASSTEIRASTAAVWTAITKMENMGEHPALPYRLGVAYPKSAHLLGEGVGAIRHGDFSTGVAIERVTIWRPEQQLSFDVLQEPPAMRELSPYENVHAPHVHGYFTTKSGSFLLEPVGQDRTRLTVYTTHELRLDPLFYWLPIARWTIEKNTERVLAHVKQQAERDQPSGSAPLTSAG